MMYPRLKLAQNLLAAEGVIFISIADHEIHNLRSSMNEIFGEENFVACVIWQKVFSPKNTARHFSEDHDYLVVYAKNAGSWKPYLLPRTEEMEARYTNSDNDPRGPWTSGDLSARNYYGEGTYAVECPSGRIIDGPPPGTYWRVSHAKLKELDLDKRIWWGNSGDNVPRLKRFLTEVQSGRVPQTLWTYEEVGHTQEAKKELIAAVTFPNSDSVFDTPKPTRLIKRILQLATEADEAALVLDFFAGSGSTLDSVYQKNLEDSGNRRTILVQLPVPIKEGGSEELKTISDVTKARLRRAGKKIKDENPMFAGDLGFRVLKLDSSNILPWDPDHADLDQVLIKNVEHLKSDRSDQDVLFELLLKLGLELTVPVALREIAGKTVYTIGAGALYVCLDRSIAVAEAEPVALGLVAWHKELAPAGESQVVFRDSAFINDVAKTNLTAILQQHGLTNVRSL